VATPIRLLAAANKARMLLKPTAFGHDSRMFKTLSIDGESSIRELEAIHSLLTNLQQGGLLDKCRHLSSRLATADEVKVWKNVDFISCPLLIFLLLFSLKLVHDAQFVDSIADSSYFQPKRNKDDGLRIVLNA
jgi:hypothetical protein